MHFHKYVWLKLLETFCEDLQPGKKVVLLATGAFSPIHLGHLEMFKTAKDYLESQGYQVVGGYISPKHNDYVAGKLRPGQEDEFIDINDRINIINQSLQKAGLNWVKVFDWEARQSRPRGKYEVVQKIRQLHPDAEVLFICGEDNCPAEKYPSIVNMGGFNAIATGRGGFSSTRLRKALKSKNKQELDLLMHPDVQNIVKNLPQFNK